MEDIKLIKKIINATCTEQELEKFRTYLEENEFEIEDSFKKFYSLDKILNVISKTITKEFSASFFCFWVGIYDWIITDRVTFEREFPTDINQFIKEVISWVLHCLSCTYGLDEKELYQLLKEFTFLDEVLRNPNKWISILGKNKYKKYYLFIDEEKERYAIEYADIDRDIEYEFDKIYSLKKLKKKIKKLKNKGYVNLKTNKIND